MSTLTEPVAPAVHAAAARTVHASNRYGLGDTEVMASDGNCDQDARPMSGFSLSLTADDTASAQKYFNALADEFKRSQERSTDESSEDEQGGSE